MIELDMKEKKYLQVSKHFQQINTTPIVTKDESKVPFGYAAYHVPLRGCKHVFLGTRFVHFMYFVLHSLRNRPRTTKSFEFIEQGQAVGRFAFVQEPDWIIFDSRIDELE